MSVSESEDIRKSLKPIFLSSWLFGVPRVSFRYIYRIIYAAIILGIFIATFTVTFDSRLGVIKRFNVAMLMSYTVSQFIMFFGGTGTIVFWVAKGANALEDAIMELAKLDVELKSLGMKVDESNRKIVRRQVGLIALFLTLWMGIVISHEYIIDFMGSNRKVSAFMTFCLAYSSHGPHLLVLFGELVFSTIMYLFYQRFHWINLTLKEAAKNQEYPTAGRTIRVIPARNGPNLSTTKNTARESLLVKIERLYKVHQRLCGVIEKVNLRFSWQLYLAVSVTFSLLIYRFLILYSFTVLRLERIGVRVALNVIWIIYYVLKVWMITLTCCNTSAEANKLGIVLFRIVINDRRYHRMLSEYSAQLYQNGLHFTAGGFFSIDLSLVNSLISSITTYIFFAVDLWTGTNKANSKSSRVSN